MTTIGENGFHEVTVESKSDALKGDSITIEYQPIGGGTVIQGQSVIGVAKGKEMVFTTDFENKSISPGIYQAEFVRDDSGTERQVSVTGEDDNQIQIEVTDADAI